MAVETLLPTFGTIRLAALFAAAATLGTLAACGGGGSDLDTSSPTQAPSPAPVPSPSPSPSPSPVPSPPALATVSVSSTPLVFPSTTLGATSAPLAVTLTNTGGSSFTVKSYTNDPQFRVIGGTCLTAPIVSAGTGCTFTVAFTPTARGAATGSLTVTTDVLATLALAMAGTSPTTTSLALGTKTHTLTYPTPIAGLPDTDPATLPTDVTASLWNLTAAVATIGSKPNTPVLLSSVQPLASIPWPIRFGYWTLQSGTSSTKGAGCQVDLVGSSLVLTANGVSTTVPLDGTPPVLNSLGQAVYPGDALYVWAGERTIGTVSVVRAVEIDAFDGALLGNASSIQIGATYDSYGMSGAYGTASAIRQTATSLQRYVCSDTP